MSKEQIKDYLNFKAQKEKDKNVQKHNESGSESEEEDAGDSYAALQQIEA